jgi:hypothetical protein
MRLIQAIRIAEEVRAFYIPDEEKIKALTTLIDLGKKVTTRAPSFKNRSGMAVCTLIRSLLRAKNLQAPVQITDTEGSFTDDQIITVDETQDGEEVNIVVQYVKL